MHSKVHPGSFAWKLKVALVLDEMDPGPPASNSVSGPFASRNTWTRLFNVSATRMRPFGETAMPCGDSNSLTASPATPSFDR